MASNYNEKTEQEKENVSVNVLGANNDSTAIPDYSDEKKEGGFETRTGEVHAVAVESDLTILSHDVDAVYDRAILLTLEEVTEILEHAWMEHHDDPNFPPAVRAKMEYFLSGDASTLENYELLFEEMKIEAALIRFSSPYPEVRSVVPCVDNWELPVSTFRVWFMGTLWCGLGSFINQFFSIRQPTFTLSVNEVQLLTFPLAKFLEKVLPTRTFRLFGYNATLNPGPFNEKEHMLLTIMANTGLFAPYSTNVLITQTLPMFYGQAWASNFGYQILTGLSIQLIGFGFAGMCRRFIVYPEHCIWLFNLSTIALNKSFHDKTNIVANGWKISRMRFFLYCFTGMFVYFWLPGSLFQALSYFNWITWINPTSVAVMAVFGTISGVGLNPLPTFDWNIFSGSLVIVYPFFATLNGFIGMLISAPIILAVWYTNLFDTAYFPMSDNVTMILDQETKRLDVAQYEAYSKPYMAASNLVLYAAFFAIYTATVVHTVLYHRAEIYNGFKIAYKSIRAGEKGNASFLDWHNRAMMRYPEVPEWWFLTATVIAIILGVIGLTAYPTESSVSCIFFGIALCIVLVIPVGLILSITGVQVTLNVFAEFIGGYIYSGNALSMNYFKSYGVITTLNALAFAQDMKLAHYMKIPQRQAFAVQVYGAVVACFVSISILNYQMTQIPGVCTADQVDHFICNGENTFFTASVFWGTLGPKRVFSSGGIYPSLLWGFGVGAILPVVPFLLARRFPTSWVSKIHTVVMLNGALAWGPYSTLANYWPGLVIAWIFQVYIKRRYLAWWSKYNYILAVAFGSAIPICGILIFGIIDNQGWAPDWWGNDISYEGCDGKSCTRFEIPDIGYIGQAPSTGGWS
ncbi:OPT-domain-containing protein [Mrakia frigida]|uniref:OPT-domain-containing protein n=1 Tax=Mrakia frigida TaxID=29902 RepID=UPI003FCC0077